MKKRRTKIFGIIVILLLGLILNGCFSEKDKKDDVVVKSITKNSMILVTSGTVVASSGSIMVENDFYISKYEITQSDFNTIMGFNPSSFKSDVENNPVEGVTWYDAVMYCNKLSEKEEKTPYYTITDITYGGLGIFGNIIDSEIKNEKNITSATVIEASTGTALKGYRLPKGIEWEYAARGGASGKGYTYSGSNWIKEVAWYEDNAYPTNANNGASELYIDGNPRGTMPVGGKSPNELGIYDMSGNVCEWCQELYPRLNDSERVWRGGSWIDSADECKVSYNSFWPSSLGGFLLGFRVVRSK